MAVKFLASAKVGALYNAGEIAGFDDATEAALINDGLAEQYKPAKKEAPAAAPPAAAPPAGAQ